MKHIRMVGKLLTPIVSKKNYKLEDCKIAIASKPYLNDINKPYNSYSKPRFYGKVFFNQRPFNFIAHFGYIHLDFLSDNPEEDILTKTRIEQLGRFKNEGMGRIRWEEYNIFEENYFDEIDIRERKIKLKKINTEYIPEEFYPLLTAGLLHDLILISKKHQSKMGNLNISVENKDVRWLVENHHKKEHNDFYLKRLQKADRLASLLCRKHFQPVNSQFGYGKRLLERKEILEIKKNIEEKQGNFPELYEYIYNEKRLDNFVESQEYGLSSLRVHLLLTTQLMVK